jgi:hypothetical protein
MMIRADGQFTMSSTPGPKEARTVHNIMQIVTTKPFLKLFNATTFDVQKNRKGRSRKQFMKKRHLKAIKLVAKEKRRQQKHDEARMLIGLPCLQDQAAPSCEPPPPRSPVTPVAASSAAGSPPWSGQNIGLKRGMNLPESPPDVNNANALVLQLSPEPLPVLDTGAENIDVGTIPDTGAENMDVGTIPDTGAENTA